MTVGRLENQQRHEPQEDYRNFGMNILRFHQNEQTLHVMETKGLLNGPGQNNCFLNCAVQVSQSLRR